LDVFVGTKGTLLHTPPYRAPLSRGDCKEGVIISKIMIIIYTPPPNGYSSQEENKREELLLCLKKGKREKVFLRGFLGVLSQVGVFLVMLGKVFS